MRARGIKPGLYKDEALATLPFEARWLFPALWLLADCRGRLEDRPRVIKAEAFPFDDDIGVARVHHLLCLLNDAGFILRYEVGERKYIQVRNFEKHQNPHLNEKKKGSQIPDPPLVVRVPDSNGLQTVPEPVANGSETIPVGMIHDSRFMSIESPTLSKNGSRTEKPISERWNDFQRIWETGTGSSVGMEEAYRAWLSVAYVETEKALFSCLGSYANSQEVAGGAVFRPAKWLFEQHREKWKSRWKARDSPVDAPCKPPPGLML